MSVTSDQPRPRVTPFGVIGRLLALAVGSVVAGVIVGLMLLPFAGAAGVITRDVISDFESLPVSLSTPPLPERSVILASDGSLLATLYYQNRVEVPLNSIAPGAFDSSEMLSVAGQIFRSSHPAWGPVGSEITDLDNG